MKFGLAFATVGPAATREGLTRIAVAAEELGFESIWSTEHVVMPLDYDSVYPYLPTGRVPVPADAPFPDPLIPLAYAAALTSRIRLGTAALILPEHEPLTIAKAIANLDVLSGGRVELGVGVGWLREEYDALGIDFSTRGKRMDAMIPALRDIWSPGPTAVDTEFFRWSGVESNPKPLAGRIPIHITGHSRAAALRAARIGDGFIPGIASPEEFATIRQVVVDECASIGRPVEEIAFTAGCNGRAYSADEVRELADLGAERVHAAFWGETPEEMVAAMSDYASTVMKAVGVEEGAR
jgi:probable F420-dependent oxidoreductase